MRKLILALSGILVVLLVVFVTLILKRSESKPPAIVVAPTLTMAPLTTPTPIIYPEYLLPSPKQLAPDEDPNAYEKLPKSQQEFSSLVVTLPIKTSDYAVEFNFGNSTFKVTLYSDKGLKDYEELRKKYPNIDNSLFVITDARTEPAP